LLQIAFSLIDLVVLIAYIAHSCPDCFQEDAMRRVSRIAVGCYWQRWGLWRTFGRPAVIALTPVGPSLAQAKAYDCFEALFPSW